MLRLSVQAPGLENHVLELLVVAENGRHVCVEVEEFLAADHAVLVEVDGLHQLLEHGGFALRAVAVVGVHGHVEGGGEVVGGQGALGSDPRPDILDDGGSRAIELSSNALNEL